jgi:DNA (cytosine-5)-methyltransferase 1
VNSVELFAGAGGLALGVARAGFRHLLVSEWDKDACDTLRRNALRVPEMKGWPVVEGDVRRLDYAPFRDQVDLLAGGPPCQPFSLGGKHGGQDDRRNMFPEALRAVRELRPKAVLFENVKGLLRPGFRPYFDYVLAWLRSPDCVSREGEPWEAHRDRLRKAPPAYDVHAQLVDAADYGVPQSRERVLITAFRSDLGVSWSTPPRRTSEAALFHAQWIEGSYWEEHGMSAPKPPPAVRERIQREGRPLFPPAEARWRTLRDALNGLPKPRAGMDATEVANHVLIPGARSYPGHTGSELDQPAKTLKAGDHGVPGGENMLRGGGGRVRYFTVRESARLQTFPDAFVFGGSWSETMRQLGNAVPVELAEVFAQALRARLGAPAATRGSRGGGAGGRPESAARASR